MPWNCLRKLIPLMLSAAVLTGLSTTALAEEVTNDLQMWNTVTLQLPVTDKVDTFYQFQTRNNDNITNLDRTLLWAGAGYKIKPNLSIWQGYAWTPTYPNQPGNRLNNENRSWQQVLYTKDLKGGKLLFRNRLEERMIENTGTLLWERNMLQYTHPIKDTKFYLVGSDEVIVNLNSPHGGPKSGFDQNRLFAGVGRKLNEHTNVELGYMGAYVNKSNSPDQWAHIIFTQLVVH